LPFEIPIGKGHAANHEGESMTRGSAGVS